MHFEKVVPVIVSFVISVILCPVVIPFLKKLKFGQFVREEGPESHLKKAGTPTMGGLIILSSIVITTLLYVQDNKESLPILFMTLGCGLVGFLDDYIKVVLKRSTGLRAWQKMLGQIVVTAIFAFYFIQYTDVGTKMRIPFMPGRFLDVSGLFVPLMFLIIIGTVNGSNFTDGLDGLGASLTVLIATFFTVVAIGEGSGVSPITGAVVGSLLGFLLYNVYPARVFMGDTGSLALGGFVAATAYMMQMPLFIAIVGLIYPIELLSVILQVGYFKLTGGKRIFRMAPIHHHFELGGWSETRVVAVFSVITTVLCLIALLGL